MKVALLISGYLRTYKNNIDFIKNEILNKYDTDVYLHITKNEDKNDKYFNLIDDDDINDVISILKPISTIIEDNQNFIADESKNTLYNQWTKLFKLNQLKKINEQSTGNKYDLVIKYRFDLSIQSTNFFEFENEIIYIPKDSKIDKIKLIHETDEYLADGLAFGDSESMDKYFDIFHNLPNLIEKHGSISETILFNHLKNNRLKYELIDIEYAFLLSKCNIFAICGDSGSGKSTLSGILKNYFDNSFTLELDRYHKWERKDDNWKKTTHLNPNANYIEKMHEDIFNLKVGKDVYQVDYDHTTGKFTEKQVINSTDNIIVCGLHSLYDYDSSVYDLKIFMDTEERLKKKWKIKRDVIERGHSLEQVLNSIHQRKDDYIKYILPQKENADLIIRFSSKEFNDIDEVTVIDPNRPDDLELKLSISKKYSISKILFEYDMHKIKMQKSEDDEFYHITFDEYIPINIIRNPTNTFYDYIKHFILNLKQ